MTDDKTQLDRARGALLGLAVGDALGTTYEFARIDQPAYPTLATAPATDVVGDGPFSLPPGAITDDTQLAVCLARSLAHNGGFDAADVAARYLAWQDEAFDIGGQTRSALWQIEQTGSTAGGMIAWRASGREGAGNGSLMRTTPIAIALATRSVAMTSGAKAGRRRSRTGSHSISAIAATESSAPGAIAAVIEASIADSMLTHADPRCILACAAHNAAIAAAIVSTETDALARGRAMVEAARTAIHDGHRRLRALWADDVEGAADDAAAGHTDAPAAAAHADVDATVELPDFLAEELAAELPDVPDVDVDELALVDAARDVLLRDLDKALQDNPQVYGEDDADLHLYERAGFVRLAFRLAFWHAAHAPTWRASLVDVASRGGDADTNAAIAGALLGARDGASAIPAEWIERVLGATQRGSKRWGEAHHPRHLLALVDE